MLVKVTQGAICISQTLAQSLSKPLTVCLGLRQQVLAGVVSMGTKTASSQMASFNKVMEEVMLTPSCTTLLSFYNAAMLSTNVTHVASNLQHKLFLLV